MLLPLTTQIFSVIPSKFLTDIKNPCWYEEFYGKVAADPYMKNMYGVRLWSALKKHLYTQGGKQYRLRCLPYFYILGQPKCGTTDLYARLSHHPDIRFTIMKEPHWWARKRFGKEEVQCNLSQRIPDLPQNASDFALHWYLLLPSLFL